MSRRTKKTGSIFRKLETFVGFKYPSFIKDILLNTGYDCEHAIQTIDEKSISTIEKKIESDHPHLLKGTIYERKPENNLPFEFLLGHRALILEIPSTLAKYLKRKSDKKTEKKTKKFQEIELENLKVILINKIKNNLKYKKINCEFDIENIGDLSQRGNRVSCLVKCVFCETNTPCSFDEYWRITNYSNHVCGHQSKETREQGHGLDNGTNKDLFVSKQPQFLRARPNVLYQVQNVLMK